jgi:uncharacterized membrane protein YbhN (UPF0104 family)
MDVLAVLTSFAPAQFLLPFSVSLLVELVVAMRLVLLLKTQRVEIPFSHALGINLSARFFSLWLPGGNVAGFGVRVLQTASFSGDMAGSIAAIAVDRLVATGTLFLIGALSILLDATTAEVTFVVPANFFRIALYIALPFFVGALATLVLLPRLVPAFLAKSTKYANALIIRFHALLYGPAFVAIALSMFAHVLGTWAFFMVARSIGLDFDFWTMGWIRAALIISALLPISLGGLGVREATALLLLPLYGVSQEAAIAFALLTFCVSRLSIALIGGLVSMAWTLKRRLRESAIE